MRVFRVKVFVRFQRKEGVRDAVLRKAVQDAEAGLIEADLGQGLIKQRVARPGAGRRGGYRTIIAYRRRDRAVFLYGFAKNAKADLTPDELEDVARNLAARVDLWEPLVHDDATHRRYELVYEDDRMDAWVLSWMPGQGTGFHDHYISGVGLCIARGCLGTRGVGDDLDAAVTSKRHVERLLADPRRDLVTRVDVAVALRTVTGLDRGLDALLMR